MDEMLLGIDVGTTGAKAALVSPEGRLLALGRSEYGLQHLRPGWVEQKLRIIHLVLILVKLELEIVDGISGEVYNHMSHSQLR